MHDTQEQDERAAEVEEEKPAKPKRPRGFAAIDPEVQRAIAAKGGRAAHEQGTAHEFTSDEARVAGRKGGEAASKNRQRMAEIGRLGGLARAQAREGK